MTLAKNPSCWMCQNNLALPLLQGSREEIERAVPLLEESFANAPAREDDQFPVPPTTTPMEA